MGDHATRQDDVGSPGSEGPYPTSRRCLPDDVNPDFHRCYGGRAGSTAGSFGSLSKGVDELN